MRAIEVNMERRGGNGRSRENPPTSDFVRHDSHMRKSAIDPAGNRTQKRLRYNFKMSKDKIPLPPPLNPHHAILSGDRGADGCRRLVRCPIQVNKVNENKLDPNPRPAECEASTLPYVQAHNTNQILALKITNSTPNWLRWKSAYTRTAIGPVCSVRSARSARTCEPGITRHYALEQKSLVHWLLPQARLVLLFDPACRVFNTGSESYRACRTSARTREASTLRKMYWTTAGYRPHDYPVRSSQTRVLQWLASTVLAPSARRLGMDDRTLAVKWRRERERESGHAGDRYASGRGSQLNCDGGGGAAVDGEKQKRDRGKRREAARDEPISLQSHGSTRPRRRRRETGRDGGGGGGEIKKKRPRLTTGTRRRRTARTWVCWSALAHVLQEQHASTAYTRVFCASIPNIDLPQSYTTVELTSATLMENCRVVLAVSCWPKRCDSGISHVGRKAVECRRTEIGCAQPARSLRRFCRRESESQGSANPCSGRDNGLSRKPSAYSSSRGKLAAGKLAAELTCKPSYLLPAAIHHETIYTSNRLRIAAQRGGRGETSRNLQVICGLKYFSYAEYVIQSNLQLLADRASEPVEYLKQDADWCLFRAVSVARTRATQTATAMPALVVLGQVTLKVGATRCPQPRDTQVTRASRMAIRHLRISSADANFNHTHTHASRMVQLADCSVILVRYGKFDSNTERPWEGYALESCELKETICKVTEDT
ncbi:hypothetical protein PR048_018474 [Dryococelus australis]|uniref:Uncharacterized protein n=1 Tax=Dryococelus australis TaxID=614101 RepID=A0ABQ9HCD9_9NEOP|nr:hypothetical protein PR048_018474 [Dryococelus australis]